MSFPADIQEFRTLVQTMRDLGVVQAFGVVLGPEPSRADRLQVELRDAKPEQAAILAEEIEDERRRAKLEALRQDLRDKLAATGREYTDDELDRFIDPRFVP